jgi:WD40 repeat protein
MHKYVSVVIFGLQYKHFMYEDVYFALYAQPCQLHRYLVQKLRPKFTFPRKYYDYVLSLFQNEKLYYPNNDYIHDTYSVIVINCDSVAFTKQNDVIIMNFAMNKRTTLIGDQSMVSIAYLFGDFILSCDNIKVFLWNIKTGECIKKIMSLSSYDSFYVLAKFNDKSLVIGQENVVRMLDIESGVWTKSFEGHEHSVVALVVTQYYKIVSGSVDDTIRVWDPESGDCIMKIDCDLEYVISVLCCITSLKALQYIICTYT